MSRRSAVVGLLVAVPLSVGPLALAGAASAQTCLPGAPSGVPCLPGASPSPSAPSSPAPGPSDAGRPATQPAAQPAAAASSAPAPVPALPAEGEAVAPALEADGLVAPAAAPALPEDPPAPDVAPEAVAPAEPVPAEVAAPVVAQARPVPVAQVAPRSSVAQSLAGAFALVVGVLLAVPLLLALLAGRLARTQQLARVAGRLPRATGLDARTDAATDDAALRLSAAGLPAELAQALSLAVREAVAATLTAVGPSRPPSRPTTPGAPVNPSGNRLYLALGCLGLAALAGFVGWYQLSANPNVNEQLPYLASAGVIVVIASAVGGALLVADQLRGDDRRLEDLEEAVRDLAAALAPSIEAPPRRPARGLGAAVPRQEEPLYDDEPVEEVVARPARAARPAAPRRSRVVR